jgi:hypothetical protein
MENNGKYVHSPLHKATTVCIAWLFPGEPNDILCFALQECNLDDESFEYEPLSCS